MTVWSEASSNGSEIFSSLVNMHVPFFETSWMTCTVKKIDEVVRHLHLVMQDQFTLVSEKVFGIPEENFTKNIELF